VTGDLLSTVLWPFKWLVEAILVACHHLLGMAGFPGGDGLTWVLSVLGLVIVVRVLLTPLFVRQVRSQQKMAEIAPRLKDIQETYKGRTDRESREAMSRDTMELYRTAGTSPFASFLPLLIQLPIMLSLFQVLNTAMRSPDLPGVAFLSAALSFSFGHASVLGAPLRFTLLTPGAPPAVLVIGVALIMVIAASQVLSQLLNLRASTHRDDRARSLQGQQKALLYLLPTIVIASNITFPLGVTIYWAFSSVWTLGQTFLITRPLPPGRLTTTPG
jgi:YidC/Oxa1 family membrane protein insertase